MNGSVKSKEKRGGKLECTNWCLGTILVSFETLGVCLAGITTILKVFNGFYPKNY